MSFLKKLSNLFSTKNPEGNASTNTNLSIPEILMLSLNPQKNSGDLSFPGYWEYQYEVNAPKLFKSLVSKGYYVKQTSIENTLNRKKVDELRALLKEFNLPSTGTKAVLIERLLKESTEKQLASIDLIEEYVLSEIGQDIVNSHEHIAFFHRNAMDISPQQAHDFKVQNPNASPIEIAHNLLEKMGQDHLKKGNWGLYRNTRLYLAQAETTVGNSREALNHYYEVCYLDISGLSNNFNLDYLNRNLDKYYKYNSAFNTMAPGVIDRVLKLMKKLNLPEDKAVSEFEHYIEAIKLPLNLFDHKTSVEIFKYELKQDKEKLNSIYEDFKKSH